MRVLTLTAAAMLAFAASAMAQPAIDGTFVGDEAFYGAALSTQNTRTQFGDNSSDDLILTADGGSELNQVFATVSGDRLFVMITGNLETNFNKLDIYIDSVPGGVNTIVGADHPTDVDGFCCGQTDPTVPTTGGALQNHDGLTFDAGFNADRFLTISNGFETVNDADPDEPERSFWAVNASFADLTTTPADGAAFTAEPLGIQLAPKGLPQVLRNPMDYNSDGAVNAADYTVWRDSLGQTGPGLAADGNGDEVVDIVDYENWKTNFGADASLAGGGFNPSVDFSTEAQLLRNVTLPGLSQGQLIDSTYALGAGGCTNDEGDGCVAEELEFVLPPASDEAANESDHRFFTNTRDVQLAFDNSNVDGVLGFTTLADGPLAGEAESATTGIEFSIPLSELGNPTGDIKLFAAITGGDHKFFSNQFAGVGVEDANIAELLLSTTPVEDRVSLADFVGDQFVTISVPAGAGALGSVPEPASLVTLALGCLAVVTRRRR
ncbi:MAG: PEP-CTERM sorting domain-containing protein [Planctomycetota bacterium]